MAVLPAASGTFVSLSLSEHEQMGEQLVHMTKLPYASDNWQLMLGDEAKDVQEGKVETVSKRQLMGKEWWPGNACLSP